jgi:hypothetical protein
VNDSRHESLRNETGLRIRRKGGGLWRRVSHNALNSGAAGFGSRLRRRGRSPPQKCRSSNLVMPRPLPGLSLLTRHRIVPVPLLPIRATCPHVIILYVSIPHLFMSLFLHFIINYLVPPFFISSFFIPTFLPLFPFFLPVSPTIKGL